MPRVLRCLFVLTVIVLTAAVASAQPSGGGSGQATPVPGGPATRPPVIRDFEDILENPETAMGELFQLIQTRFEEFVRDNQVRFDRNLDALPDAARAGLTRGLAILFGVLALLLPRSSKILAWLFLGAVIGAIVAQLPIGQEIKLALFRSDLDFMLDEPIGSIALIGGFAILGLIVLSPAYFFAITVAGALAGITIALRITQNAPSLAGASIAIGGIIGFILMAWAVGRGSLLIPLAIGAGLVVFGLGLGVGWMIPLGLLAGLFAAVRSPQMKTRMKRVSLPTLTLQEGKVDLSPSGSGKQNRREHLHEILPAMADDRDNPLIKR